MKRHGIYITDIFYCPHLPDAKFDKYRVECECRKPKLGMFYKAAKKWNIDLDSSWAIGDRERDCTVCKVTGCRGIIIGEIEHFISSKKLYYSNDMVKAAKIIIQKQEK